MRKITTYIVINVFEPLYRYCGHDPQMPLMCIVMRKYNVFILLYFLRTKIYIIQYNSTWFNVRARSYRKKNEVL